MSQCKSQSIAEVITNTAIGFIVSFITQLIVFPIFSVEVSVFRHIGITACFTIVSIVRGYIVRRLFNQLTFKKETNENHTR